MRIPDLSGTHGEHGVPTADEQPQRDEVQLAPPNKKAKEFGKRQDAEVAGIQRRAHTSSSNGQVCPAGTEMYSCSNGFHGCASKDPCAGSAKINKAPPPMLERAPVDQLAERAAVHGPAQTASSNGHVCPDGTSHFACSNGFIGCASTDPCQGAKINKAPPPMVERALEKTSNGQICAAGTNLYSCTNGFHGCASTDPCQGAKINKAPPPMAERAVVQDTHNNRQVCPAGTELYACSTGFHGCASKDPCIGGVKINKAPPTLVQRAPDDQPAVLDIRSQVSSSAAGQTHYDTIPSDAALVQPLEPAASASVAGRVLLPARALESVSPPLKQAPSCPSANNTVQLDPSSVSYLVHCNADNTALSFGSIQVGVGGYSQCFSSCSTNSNCAGFTYVGGSQGECYYKASMPNSSYVATTQSSYISCVKIKHIARPVPLVYAARDAQEIAPTTRLPMKSVEATAAPAVTSTSSTARSSKGAIVGGSLSAVILIGLVLALLVVFIRRRRSGKTGSTSRRARGVPGLMEPSGGQADSFVLPSHELDGNGNATTYSPFANMYQLPPSPSKASFSCQPTPAQHHARQRSIYRDRSGAI